MASVILISVIYIKTTYLGAASAEEARITTQAKAAVNFIVIIDVYRTVIRTKMYGTSMDRTHFKRLNGNKSLNRVRHCRKDGMKER